MVASCVHFVFLALMHPVLASNVNLTFPREKVLRLGYDVKTFDNMGAAMIAMETAQKEGLLPGWQIRYRDTCPRSEYNVYSCNVTNVYIYNIYIYNKLYTQYLLKRWNAK